MTDSKNTILISIHPQFVSDILNESKKYEYRKRIPKHIKKMVIYSTSPVKAIVAIADIEDIICNTPKKLWASTKHASGISHKFFMDYFNQKECAYAIKIGNIQEFEFPVELSQIDSAIAPPQSFQYLNNCMVEKIKNLSIENQRYALTATV